MTIDQAKIICKAHINYILENIHNNHTPEEIGIAIELIAKKVSNNEYSRTLSFYNMWRRGDLADYPNDSMYNMIILLNSIDLCIWFIYVNFEIWTELL